MNRRLLSRTAAMLLLAGLATQALAAVEREDIIVLGADGRHYTSYKTLRSDLAERVLYLGPDEAPEDAVFIVPQDYEATPLDDGGTRLHFKSGSFALMNTGVFDAELERQGNGVHVFSSWDGVTRDDGHLGKWNAPDDFASFSYTWVVPRNIEILAYDANREGSWERRENTLNWTGKQVNDIAFNIRYKVNEPTDGSPAQPASGREQAISQQRASQTRPASPPQPVPRQPRQRPPMQVGDLEIAPSTSISDEPLSYRPPERRPEPESASQQQTAPASTTASEPSSGGSDAPARSVTLESVVTLDDGRPQITARGERELRRLAGVLANGQLQRVVIHGPGFAQSRDMGGSVAQAARVSDFLTAHGVDEDRIQIRAGERTDTNGQSVRIAAEPGAVLEAFEPNG